jgi:hypothetical protein
MSCDLLDCIFLGGPLIEALDQTMHKFTLCEYFVTDRLRGYKWILTRNMSLLYQISLLFEHSHPTHGIYR